MQMPPELVCVIFKCAIDQKIWSAINSLARTCYAGADFNKTYIMETANRFMIERTILKQDDKFKWIIFKNVLPNGLSHGIESHVLYYDNDDSTRGVQGLPVEKRYECEYSLGVKSGYEIESMLHPMHTKKIIKWTNGVKGHTANIYYEKCNKVNNAWIVVISILDVVTRKMTSLYVGSKETPRIKDNYTEWCKLYDKYCADK